MIPTAPSLTDWQNIAEDLSAEPLSAALLERSILRVGLRAAHGRIAELEQAVRGGAPTSAASNGPAGADG